MENIRKEIDKGVKNTKDAIDESQHRNAAENERADRALDGDAMTPGEKAGSVAKELKHETQAEVDAAKRKARE